MKTIKPTINRMGLHGLTNKLRGLKIGQCIDDVFTNPATTGNIHLIARRIGQRVEIFNVGDGKGNPAGNSYHVYRTA